MAHYTNVSSTAVVVATPAPGNGFEIVNIGNATAYLSNNTGVTTTTGFPLTPGSKIFWTLPYNATTSSIPTVVYGITQTAVSGQQPIGTTLSVHGHSS